MKKVLIILALLIGSQVIFGQAITSQRSGAWASAGSFEQWKARTDSVLADTFWVTGTDTVYSEVMFTWPFMDLAAEVGDSSSTDSRGYKLNVYQWVYYRTDASYRTADLAKFVFVKSLVWNGTTEAKTYLANIDTTGSWMAHITEDTIFAAPFWRVEIIGTADNKAGGAGSWIKLYATAFSSR